jgi:hypothetical protein
VKRGKSEAGFALLFVYAMAATVAVMLLMQLPSAAFEAQRDREQLLIDRGEQYSRGVQLYVRKFNRYPTDMDALESTQNQHFLRHRYTDPLTGRDEWRLIHVGPGGVFTDSLLYTKKKDPNATEKQTFITELPSTAPDPTGAAGVNLATRRGANPNDPNGQSSGQPGMPVQGQQGQGIPGQVLPGMSYPGQTNPGQVTGQFGNPNQQQQQQQILPGGLPPGVQLPPGTQLPPGVQLPGQAGGAPGGAAANLINQLLTTPRPGGLGGLGGVGGQQPAVDQFGNPTQQNPAQGGIPGQQPGQQPIGGLQQPGQQQQQQVGQAQVGQTIGGGIAGVASKVEQEGIKRYRDRSLYNEWEFVYDITKDTSRPGGAAQQQPGAPGAPGASAPGAAPNSPFGQTQPQQSQSPTSMPAPPPPPPQPPPQQ